MRRFDLLFPVFLSVSSVLEVCKVLFCPGLFVQGSIAGKTERKGFSTPIQKRMLTFSDFSEFTRIRNVLQLGSIISTQR